MTGRMRFAVVIAVATAAPLAAAPPPMPVPKKVLYYPDRIGTKWVYDIMGSESTIVTSHVEKTDKGIVVTAEYEADDGKRTPCHKYLVSDTGVWMTEEVGETYEPAWQLFKAPFKAGDKWEVATKRRDMHFSGNYSLSGEEDVTVPAGKFKAVKVTCTDFKFGLGVGTSEVSWYSPGVGEVKRESDGGMPIVTLKSFTPGKE